MMIHFHLLGKIFFKHGILLNLILNETDGHLSAYLDRRFTLFLVVEPGFGPPPYTATVRIDCNQSRYVKALYVYLQF
ncbi:MAG: hypothetical protein IJN02_00975 [Bacteroidales bacterium]|nr:hypothetical protein [Bacteroidales bacterium]